MIHIQLSTQKIGALPMIYIITIIKINLLKVSEIKYGDY